MSVLDSSINQFIDIADISQPNNKEDESSCFHGKFMLFHITTRRAVSEEEVVV